MSDGTVENVEKPEQMAAKPAKKAAKKSAKKAAKKAGPTVAEYTALERKNAELLELARKRREEADGLKKQQALLNSEVLLLRAGINPRWTDQAILQALYGADVDEGPLGALLAVLEREINQVRAEGEVHEDRGDREKVPGYVRAGFLLTQVKDKIIKLHKEANHGRDESAGHRASRYVE